MGLRQETIYYPAKTAAAEWSEVRNVAYGAYKKYTVQINITGSPTTVTVKIYGSLDKSKWVDFHNHTMTAGELSAGVSIAIPQTEPIVNYIKAELVTLTGGTSPTVTVYLKMCE